MTEPGNELDAHLDRLMETAYEALAGGGGALRPDLLAEPERPDRIGPYKVTALLGRGGTSIVWKAVDPDLGREIAIKVVDPRHAPEGSLAARFLDEARLCSRLTHPGIVPIYGMGKLADGRPWFTMQLVEGKTLAALLQARQDTSDRLQQFLEILARTCETVAFAHARGVVHGDIKPGNVMVGTYGQVQVVDWGFSRLVDEPASTARRGIGTPAFMAPEQAAGGAAAIDTRTDVFGLGAILCVILTGQPPFVGGSRSEIHVRAAQGNLDGARERLQACRADPGLVRLAADCLALTPADRPADAAAVQSRLSAWFVSIEQRAHRLELAAAQAEVKAREQRRTRARTVALALLAVAFVGVYVWTQFDRQAREYEARTAVVQAIERARSQRAGAEIAAPNGCAGSARPRSPRRRRRRSRRRSPTPGCRPRPRSWRRAANATSPPPSPTRGWSAGSTTSRRTSTSHATSSTTTSPGASATMASTSRRWTPPTPAGGCAPGPSRRHSRVRSTTGASSAA